MSVSECVCVCESRLFVTLVTLAQRSAAKRPRWYRQKPAAEATERVAVAVAVAVEGEESRAGETVWRPLVVSLSLSGGATEEAPGKGVLDSLSQSTRVKR